jgi:type VI secretion system protein ImpJ
MKPYWPRTLQLLPAHLDARDGYVEDLLALRARRCAADAYGILDLAFDEMAGARGEIVVQRLEAILPSGLVVRVDAQGPLRRPVPDAPAGACVSRDVYLAVPRAILRGPNVSPEGGHGRSTRYVATAAKDAFDLAWLRAKPEILFQEEIHEGLEWLRLGRARSFGRSVRFERDAVPTVLRVRASSALEEGLRRLVLAFETRRRELARYRVDHPLNLGAVVAAELPGLQLSVILQRWLPLLKDVAVRRSAHPRELYEILVAVHGALAASGTAEIAPTYAHDEPGGVFPWLFERIDRLLEEAAREGTTALPFQRVNETTFRLSFERGDLVGKRPLLVLSGGDEGFLRERVPSLLKMASPSAMAPLLDRAVRGVAVAVEFEPPPAIPRRSGAVAYRIDVRDPLWMDIEDRMQIQLNLLGAPPALEAVLYGVERVI